MKTQSFKLFAMALVLGLVTVFGAAAASAQTKLSFETSFDFHVGDEKYAAGKYELVRSGSGVYVLRGADGGAPRIVRFDVPQRNADAAQPQRLVFNRYGETFFMRGLFERADADGRLLAESKYEKRLRRGADAERLAEGSAKPEKVSVRLTK